jgi:hypothetical protein
VPRFVAYLWGASPHLNLIVLKGSEAQARRCQAGLNEACSTSLSR